MFLLKIGHQLVVYVPLRALFLVLIGSTSYLQVMRTSITSRMSLKFGQIRPRTAELAALGHLEKSP